MKKEEEKAEMKVLDFSQLEVEVNIDEFHKLDVSKNLGNFIHQQTIDIGLDELARTIYKEGRSYIPEEYVEDIKTIVKQSAFIAPVKVAIIKLLTNKD